MCTIWDQVNATKSTGEHTQSGWEGVRGPDQSWEMDKTSEDME